VPRRNLFVKLTALLPRARVLLKAGNLRARNNRSAAARAPRRAAPRRQVQQPVLIHEMQMKFPNNAARPLAAPSISRDTRAPPSPPGASPARSREASPRRLPSRDLHPRGRQQPPIEYRIVRYSHRATRSSVERGMITHRLADPVVLSHLAAGREDGLAFLEFRGAAPGKCN